MNIDTEMPTGRQSSRANLPLSDIFKLLSSQKDSFGFTPFAGFCLAEASLEYYQQARAIIHMLSLAHEGDGEPVGSLSSNALRGVSTLMDLADLAYIAERERQ